MLLIVVTGPVGSGKTSLLNEVSERLLARGKSVAGFLQPAGPRIEGHRGAESYDLVLIPAGERFPFAVRDETRRPRYVFSEPALELAFAGAEIVALDEFGPWEATGAGHFRFWPAIVEANPTIVLMAVREDQLPAVGDRLGRPFDLVVDVREPHSAQRLEALCVGARDWEAVGVYGAGAGALEASLGSALHGAKVPLRGQFLSTLQALVMTSAAEGLANRERVAWVALVAAGLKALSPAGSRLRPMLAISVQGILYSAAIRFLGWSRFSVFLGGVLIGAWSSGQGILLQWLLVGNDLFKAYDITIRWISARLGLEAPALPIVLAAFIAASALLTGTVTAGFWSRRNRGLERLKSLGPARPPKAKSSHPFLTTLRELFHPAFWLPIAFILVVLLATGTRWQEASMIALRAFTVGLVLFGLVRLIRVQAIAGKLQRRGLLGPAVAINRAFRRP